MDRVIVALENRFCYCWGRLIITAVLIPLMLVAAGVCRSVPATRTLSPTGIVLSPLSSGEFPIAVWLQEPSLAKRYAAAGINLYVGLWQGPTDQQLSDLKAAGMPVICEQNAIGLQHLSDPTIVGWMQIDEPDNAQPIPGQPNSYGPCVPPSSLLDRYNAMRTADPTRPVYLGLGQGVANDDWYGRGNGTSLDDYKTYVKGGDILSYDVYPMAGLHDVNKLWFVAKGLDRFKGWSNGTKTMWEAIECTDIGGEGGPTPDQVRSEIWMVLVHGATGIVYFVHQFKPTEDDNELLDNPTMLAAVTSINQELHQLSPVLLSPTVTDGATVKSSNDQAPIDILVKHHNDSIYILAAGMRNGAATGTFIVKGVPLSATADVIGEGRSIPVHDSQFTDNFTAYGTHTYRIH
jgi:hypothetical protein